MLHLILAVCGAFSELYVRAGVRGAGDATAAADAIRATATLFRIAFVTDLVNSTCFAALVPVYASPPSDSSLTALLSLPAAVAEISLLGWLLVKGVPEPTLR